MKELSEEEKAALEIIRYEHGLVDESDEKVKEILEGLFYNKLDMGKDLKEWLFEGFDTYEDWLKYGGHFIHLSIE
jgi:hypothetical protein